MEEKNRSEWLAFTEAVDLLEKEHLAAEAEWRQTMATHVHEMAAQRTQLLDLAKLQDEEQQEIAIEREQVLAMVQRQGAALQASSTLLAE